jgi:signal transduction histidine kinase
MSASETHQSSDLAFLAGDKEMARLMRRFDWAQTSLGPLKTWPQSLRSALLICLNTPIVSAVHWGPELRTLYNDAYAPALAERHPWALGQPFCDVWAEIWDVLGPQIAAVMETGHGFSTERQRLKMNRNGRFEDTWWIYSFAPLYDDDGRIGGIFVTALDESDKVLAEHRLANERDRQRKLFEQAPGFMAVLSGPELRFEFVNEAYKRAFGQRDYVGRTMREVFPDLQGQPFFDLLDKAYVTGDRFVARASAIRLQPSPGAEPADSFLDFIYEPVRNEAGAITGLFIEGYDVSEAHVVQQALRESEARFRALVNASSDVVYQMSADWTELRQLDGRGFLASTDEPSVRWLDSYLFPEDRPHIMAAVGKAIETRSVYELEHRVRQANGNPGWTFSRAVPVLDDKGEIVEWFGMASDVTERKHAEARLQALNETLEERVASALAERKVFSDVIDGSTAAVTALDLDFRILAINKTNVDAFERVYGKRPRVGDHFLSLFDDMPAHIEQQSAIWRRALSGEEFIIVQAFGDTNHDRRYYEVRFSTLRDSEGRMIGAASTSYDATDKVQAEQQLEAAQNQLRQSQKMEAMGQLTGGVAHDFNNLLGPIVGSLDLLQRRGLGGEREQRLIANALQSADRARILVQRLLAFARRQPLQAEAVDVGALIEGMADLVASTSGPTVRVEIDVATDLPPARADANQIEMAILNLSVNARDAMADGGRLIITAAVETVEGPHRANLPAGTYIHLSVADTGAGMDEATLGRAVEPFFSTKGIGKGTGLGLSMVHGLAAQLGGGLAIDSKPGLGTKVELWLPVSTEAVEPSSETDTLPTAPRTGTALLVDDEELVRVITADMLSELGYAVIEAGSGEDALRLFGEGSGFDLVVTDHLMSGMSGTELVRQLRIGRPDLSALIVSGYADVEGVAPDIARLVKPFRQADLAAAIAQLISD